MLNYTLKGAEAVGLICYQGSEIALLLMTVSLGKESLAFNNAIFGFLSEYIRRRLLWVTG